MISLYTRGMSTGDIHDQLNGLYGIELSAEMVSKITYKINKERKMASLTHASMCSEHGWKRITADEAAKIYPEGTVSAESGLSRTNVWIFCPYDL